MNIYPYQRLERKKTANSKTLRITLPSFRKISKGISGLYAPETLLVVALAFFCGRALLFGELAPLGLAFSAGVTAIFPEFGLISSILAIAGYTTVLKGANLAATIISMVLLIAILGKCQNRFRQIWYGPPMLVLGILTIIKISAFAYQGADLYRYLTIVFEAVLAAGATFVFFRAAPLLKRKQVKSFRWEERLFIVFALIGLLAGLNGINAGPLSIQRTVGSFIILVAVFFGGGGWGAAVGALVGVIPSLSTLVTPALIGYFAFAGLAAGVFRNFGRLGIGVGFLLGTVLLSLYFTGANAVLAALGEGAAAIVLFFMVPSKTLHRARTSARITFGENEKSAKDQRVRSYSARKIREFSRVFTEVAKTVEQVSCELQHSNEKDLQQLFNGITGKVCSGCSLYRVCWESEFYKTYKNIMDLLAALELNSRIEEEHLAPELRKRCIRLRDLAITVNCLYDTYKTNNYWKRKMVESREVVSGQLRGLSSILQNLANEVRMDVQMREDIEAILRSELAKAGHTVMDLTVVTLGDDKLELVISSTSCGGKLKCSRSINPIVSKILGQRMTVINNNYCSRKTGESVCEFNLHPAKTLNVNIGYAQAAKGGNHISGDNASTIELKDGKKAFLLSDGMGVGAKAASESKATIELMEQLLETGFDKNLAVKTVNSLLVLRSPEESFSTVDLTVIDLYSGEAEFLKIGAASSFIKRPNRVDLVKNSSLPMGILNNIEVEGITHKLNAGDVVVMVSDGVLDSKKEEANKEDWVIHLLHSIVTTDPQNIADLILNRAINNAGGLADDDMLVLVAEVTQWNI